MEGNTQDYVLNGSGIPRRKVQGKARMACSQVGRGWASCAGQGPPECSQSPPGGGRGRKIQPAAWVAPASGGDPRLRPERKSCWACPPVSPSAGPGWEPLDSFVKGLGFVATMLALVFWEL